MGEQIPNYAWTYLNLGNLCTEQRRLPQAEMLYARALALASDLAEAHNGLGVALLARGKLTEASACFARALALAPELAETYADLCRTLFRVCPTIKDVTARAVAAWPQMLAVEELFGLTELATIADDPLLLTMLEMSPVRDYDLERMLTLTRAAALSKIAQCADGEFGNAPVLRFMSRLAQQCFINEYVFLVSPEEESYLDRLIRRVSAAIEFQAEIPPLWLALTASYVSLETLPGSEALLRRSWPAEVEQLLTQQIRRVGQERELRGRIPQLTAIRNDVSLQVREQYEENPYPRWVVAGSQSRAETLDDLLHRRFPTAPFHGLGKPDHLDILIAGCGTGQHSIAMARALRNAHVLAIDLSLSSLSYAIRKTSELGLENVEYGQADLMELAGLGRTFDVIDASGVLHHLAEPFAGWEILLALLRPQGIMAIGLYSEVGRREIVAAQQMAKNGGVRPVPDDIRRCRRDLMATPLRSIGKFHDFFTVSECRDLLFHVKEHRHTIPQIKSFMDKHGLRFIGFELPAAAKEAYRLRFPEDPSMTDLDRWHQFEIEHPDTFTAMYQLWMVRQDRSGAAAGTYAVGDQDVWAASQLIHRDIAP